MPRTFDELAIICMRVGQGDCTLVEFPDGHVAVIDIGSKEFDPVRDNTGEPILIDDPNKPGKKIQQVFMPLDDFKRVFKDDKTLNTLILSHPDQDHYNWASVLNRYNVKIDKVYYSTTWPQYKQGSKQSGNEGSANYWIEQMCLDDDGATNWGNIRSLTLSDEDKCYFTLKNGNRKKPKQTVLPEYDGAPADAPVGHYVAGRGLKLHQCGNAAMYILCSNVTRNGGDGAEPSTKRRKLNSTYVERAGAEKINMASIVVLIECGANKYVICGDAVGETEQFILREYPEIKDVTMLRVPHHGSSTYDSSHEPFVQKMNPQTVIISAPRMSRQHKHPEYLIIDRYITHASRLADRQSKTVAWEKYDVDPEDIVRRWDHRHRVDDINKDVRVTGIDDFCVMVDNPVMPGDPMNIPEGQ